MIKKNQTYQEYLDEIDERASASLRAMSREEFLQFMIEIGALGVVPCIGDKIRIDGWRGDYQYAIIVGASENGRLMSVYNDKNGNVVFGPLEDLSEEWAVQLVERAPEGQELSAAARALQLRETHTDLSCFELASAPGELSPALAFFTALGLVVDPVTLSQDDAWHEHRGRYRDGRHRAA